MTTPRWNKFAVTAAARHGAPPGDYAELWQWSVDKPAQFWRAVWDYFDVGGPGDALADGEAAVLAAASMPGAQWFPNVELNYVDLILRRGNQDGAAIIGVDESGARTQISWKELPGQIGSLAAELRRL